MKHLLLLSIAFVFFTIPVMARDDNDPLAQSRLIRHGAGEEIVNMSLEYNYPNNAIEISLYKYFRELEYMPQDTMAKMLSWSEEISGSYNVFFDLAVADLDNDGLNEIAAVWLARESETIELVVLKPDPDLLGIDSLANWQREERYQIADPQIIPPDVWGLYNPAFIQAGNFDSDSLMELAVTYWKGTHGVPAHEIMIELFDLTDSLKIHPKGMFHGPTIEHPPLLQLCEDEMFLFDIECGDFNADGIDEIALVGRDWDNYGAWEIYTDIIAYDEQQQGPVLKSHNRVYTQMQEHFDIWSFNLAVDHILSTEKEHMVISFFEYCPTVYEHQDDPPDTVSYTLIPLEISDNLDTAIIGSFASQYQDTIPADCYYNRLTALETRDVNNDGIAEIFSAFSFDNGNWYQDLKVYQADEQLGLNEWADLVDITDEFYANIALGDVLLDTLETTPVTELIVMKRERYSNQAAIYQLITDENRNFEEARLLHYGPALGYAKSENVKIGDFDGDIQLGLPRRFSVTKILQPLVILNAPPIHFDVLDNVSYDVSMCYNNNQGEFVSSYIKESSQFAEVETEVNMDWSLSWTASTGISFWGVSVSSHLSETYGKRFSKVANSSTKVTVGISVDALEDDRIYAMVMDYNIYEYPVYVNQELKGNILVVEPLVAENRWFPSKSWSGYDYIPNHEVGNILSYREYPLLSNNPMLDEKIKGDYNNSFVLDANSSYDWTLQFEDFESNEVTTAKEFSRDWGVSVSGWGSGFSLNGSYSSEDIQTQRTSVSNGLQIEVHLDAIDMGLGEVGYIVTPYSYWANNGALVVDYAVKPELAAPGGTDTWWQVHYGDDPDPAFILPWRYDPEKGFTLQDPAKRYQTKDITFTPSNPKAGDKITIEARVHNFSLIPTAGPIPIRFYIGDPDSGGIVIEDQTGAAEVYTDEAIPARGTKMVHMDWELPSGIGTFPRIYAVIDAQDNVTEVHESNNKSWNILQKSTATAVSHNSIQFSPGMYNLFQNYPNPFNPLTTIEFSLPKSEFVELKVYNILGKEVANLVSAKLQQGNHNYTFDGSNLASGVYYYTLTTEQGYSQTRKLVLLK